MRRSREQILQPGVAFHKIWRCHNRERLLESHYEKRAYLKAIRDDYVNRCDPDEFLLYAFCAMGNHIHEAGGIVGNSKAFSEHMRRAHGRFGLVFNKRHGRLGKVAHDRPKTLRIEDDESILRCMFYMDCNPVRAGLIKHPTDPWWRGLSSCRFYALGEKDESHDALEPPAAYMRLGKTPRARRRRYRSLLDRYLIDRGLLRDPRMTGGYFLGGELWVLEMRRALREDRVDHPP